MKARFHRGRYGWGRDSYRIPGNAVLGASDTGGWSDSPCRTDDVKAELTRFRKILRSVGITSRYLITSTGNIFCGKRWVVVPTPDWNRAIGLADLYLREHDAELQYAHDARA